MIFNNHIHLYIQTRELIKPYKLKLKQKSPLNNMTKTKHMKDTFIDISKLINMV